MPLELAIVTCLRVQRRSPFAVRRCRRLLVADFREDAVGLPDIGAPASGVVTLRQGQRILGQLPGVSQATRLVLQHVGEAGPAVRDSGQVAALLADAGRLPVVPFGLVPLPLFVEDPADLMPGDGLHGGLAQLLKEQQRGAVAHQRLLQISLRQRNCAEPAQVHTLGAAVFQLLGNLQRRFVGLLCLAVLAAGAERVPELRAQRAPQPFHSVAGREPAGDTHRFPQMCHGQIGLPAHVEASAEPAENDRSAVTRRLAEPGENRLEDVRRPAHVTLLQQPLATFAFGDVPRLGALRHGSIRLAYLTYGRKRYSGAVVFCPL